MIIMIDNYDSFTYNLVQYLLELGEKPLVFRNDKIKIEEIEKLSPSAIFISPGPGRPEEAGLSISIIRGFAGKVPIFGVCLGHQAIGYAFGGRIVKAKRLMHGKVSSIFHDGRTIFKDIENPFKATRYHSLALEEESLPHSLQVSARAEDGEIMGIRHRRFLLEGVQFHPESILTEKGKKILKNFLDLKEDFWRRR